MTSTPYCAVPMIHVADVAATVDWYLSIGFELRDRFPGDGDGDGAWASLTFGNSGIMLNSGGQPSRAQRRGVDLYLHVDDVDALFPTVADKGEVVEGLHDTFYGMREFIIRDCNGFWITFGHPIPDFAPPCEKTDGQEGR